MEPIIIPSSELREGDKFAFLASETHHFNQWYWSLRGDLAYHRTGGPGVLKTHYPFAQVFERASKPEILLVRGAELQVGDRFMAWLPHESKRMIKRVQGYTAQTAPFTCVAVAPGMMETYRYGCVEPSRTYIDDNWICAVYNRSGKSSVSFESVKSIGRVASHAPAPGKYQRGPHDPAIAPSSMTGKVMPPGIKTLTIFADDQSEP